MLVRSRIIISLFAFLFCSFGITQGVYAFATPQSFAPLVKAHRSKVVHISTSSIIKQRGRKSFQGRGRDPFLDRFFPNLPKKRKQSALGSGFIISSDGYIVTNNHVVAKADKIEVTLFDERSFKATVIGRDPRTDLALIKIDAKGLPFV
ncbi:MAG: serine protease Do, partial [bacterium]